MTDKPNLHVLLAAPRGFCAGVDRAIQIVERALDKFGAPVYVRHEIVHNRFVVDSLKAKGAIFIEELNEAPDGAPVVFFSPWRAQERAGRGWPSHHDRY
jgi:4-hydroxy-3-methylbut-2-enyl diphosphate reductase